MDFEPGHGRVLCQHLRDMRSAQPDAGGIWQQTIHAGTQRAAGRDFRIPAART
jgi:hypothetical protein